MRNKKVLLLAALILPLAAAGVKAGDEEAAAAKAAQNRTEVLLEDIDCSAKKDRLFFDYLSGTAQLKGTFKFRCAKGKETLSAPPWLAGEVSSMTARAAQAGKETWTEARLWQEPFAALYDFSEAVRKTRAVKDGGLGLPPKLVYGACLASLVRLDKALANLRRERLAGAFGGRGDVIFSSLEKALAELDSMEHSYDVGSQVTFYERAAAVLKNAEEAFLALSADAPALTPEGGTFSAEYQVAPRLLEGGRAMPLEFPAWQAEGLKRGDRVDLLMTYDNPVAGGAKETITATIIQAAPVLSVTRPAKDDSAEAKCSVRLILTPVQAQYAALAGVQARELRLSVRADGDAEVKPTEAANLKKIIK